MSRRISIKDPLLDSWLDEFYHEADSGRLRRGKALYREGAVIGLDDYPDEGFSAEVVGSNGTIYKIEADWSSDNRFEDLDIPFPEDISFQCSCPDKGYPCKHIVAAVIRWISEYDKEISGVSKPKESVPGLFNSNEHQTLQIRRQRQTYHEDYSLESLQYLAKKQSSVAARLGDAPFWHIKPELNHLLMFVYNDMRQFSEKNRMK
ncbi:SWIM zinc finger family protein [Scopulibacillus cellulosilyticus]|uniref:SWIM zinc finger family protein n=1 Tax=Scopulibacillus cellulosilyticus TaxID=2665665 RepID=A0ABW2Q0R1_9BACL